MSNTGSATEICEMLRQLGLQVVKEKQADPRGPLEQRPALARIQSKEDTCLGSLQFQIRMQCQSQWRTLVVGDIFREFWPPLKIDLEAFSSTESPCSHLRFFVSAVLYRDLRHETPPAAVPGVGKALAEAIRRKERACRET